MTNTEERRQTVDFSINYVDTAQMIIVQEGSPIATPDDLTGKVIGVQLGTTGDLYASDYVEGAEISRFKTGSDAGMALANGQIDAVVIDAMPAAQIVSANAGLVLLDEPQTEIRFGGTLSAPVAQKIFEAILPHLGIEPSYTNEELSTLSRTTPNVVGQTTAVAQNKVVNTGLKATVIGKGDTVLRQVPEAGQSIPAGGTVLLYTEDTEGELVTVPNLIGRTVTDVNSLAARLGLNIQLQGLVGGSSAAAVSNSQSIKEGEKVPKGTVIKVNFVYNDIEEN